MTEQPKWSYDDYRLASKLAERLVLNSYTGRDQFITAVDEGTSKKVLKVKDRALYDISIIDKFIKERVLTEKDWIAVRVLLGTRERMIWDANRKLREYNLSLNKEKS